MVGFSDSFELNYEMPNVFDDKKYNSYIVTIIFSQKTRQIHL